MRQGHEKSQKKEGKKTKPLTERRRVKESDTKEEPFIVCFRPETHHFIPFFLSPALSLNFLNFDFAILRHQSYPLLPIPQLK